jgi:hypothetical protein
MNELLSKVLEAHGGLDCWNAYEKSTLPSSPAAASSP